MRGQRYWNGELRALTSHYSYFTWTLLKFSTFISRILRVMMGYFQQGYICPVRVDKVFTAGEVQSSFRHMQQALHIGKLVVDIRDAKGSLQLGDANVTTKSPIKFHASASYLLIGGLGGLGRSVSVWMAQHGARNLTFLSRSAGNGIRDQDFVREMESMGCTIQLVKGSVTNPLDVARAIDGAVAPLKGIMQMSMILRDDAFTRMAINDWNSVTEPKVRGTWNLHNATLSRATDLDFFVLFSSLSGIVGQAGQANYAAANTFLDAFVQYRTSMDLPCSAIDIGAVEGAGFLSENEDLLKIMKATGWHAIREAELFEGLAVATQTQPVSRLGSSNFVDQHNFLLGISPAVPLSSPSASARLRQDIRMAVYHNTSSAKNELEASSGGLGPFLAKAKKDLSIFKAPETATLIAKEIGRHLSYLLQKNDEDVDISMTLSDLGMDSMVAIEMRAWWRQVFGFEISVLDMLAMGTLATLGKRATERLLALNDG
jgi:NAD(P)-dependent dehydrogenase (short-subunit alcohol dehydrogenase family)